MEGKAGSGKKTCPLQALMHRNLAGKWALMEQINMPVCFSEHTNNSADTTVPNSNKYFSNGFITVVSILLQKSVQWNLSCCMPNHPVLHSEGRF